MKTDHQLYDGTMTIDLQKLDYDLMIQKLQIIISIVSKDQIIEFPSLILDTTEYIAEIPISLIMPLMSSDILIKLDIFCIILRDESFTVTKQFSDQIILKELDQQGNFLQLHIPYSIDLKESYDRVQFLQLQNFKLDFSYCNHLDNLWIQLQTPYLSITKPIHANQFLLGLQLPQSQEFIIKIQQKIHIFEHFELVTLQQCQFNSSLSLERGRHISVKLSDYIDEKIYLQLEHFNSLNIESLPVQQLVDLLPPDYIQAQFNLNDINLPQFRPDLIQNSKASSKNELLNLKTTMTFTVIITRPMVSFLKTYENSQDYYKQIIGEYSGIMGLKVNGAVGYFGLGVHQINKRDISTNIVMQGLNNYQIIIESTQEVKVGCLFEGQDYFNFTPLTLYNTKGGISDVLDSAPIQNILIVIDNQEISFQLDLKIFKQQIIMNLLDNKEAIIKIHDFDFVFSGIQFKGQTKVQKVQTLFSNRLNLRSMSQLIDAPLLTDENNSNTSFTCSLASGRSYSQLGNTVMKFEFNMSSYQFKNLSTHYSGKIRVYRQEQEYYFEHSINTVEDTYFKIQFTIPFIWLDNDVQFQLVILEFNEDNFVFLNKTIFSTNINIYQKIQQNVQKTLIRGEYTSLTYQVPFSLDLHQNSAQINFLYINDLKMITNIESLFESQQQLWIEVQSSQFSLKQRYQQSEIFNLALPFYENNEILIKILVQIDVFGVRQFLHLQSININEINSCASQGIFIKMQLSDYIALNAVKILQKLQLVTDNNLILKLQKELPIDFWQQQFSIQQVDNNNVIVTPGLVNQQQPSEPNFTNTIQFIVKLSEKGYFQSQTYISNVEYLNQTKDCGDKLIISAEKYENYILIAQKEIKPIEYFDKVYQFSGSYNYDIYPVHQVDTILTFVYKNKCDVFQSTPLILTTAWIEGVYLTVCSENNSANTLLNQNFIKINQYMKKIQLSAASSLDYQIPNFIPEIKISLSTNIKAQLDVIDEDIHDLDEEVLRSSNTKTGYDNIGIFKNFSTTDMLSEDNQQICQIKEDLLVQKYQTSSHKNAAIAPNFFKKYPDGKKKLIPVTIKNNYSKPKEINKTQVLQKDDLHQALIDKANLFSSIFNEKKKTYKTQKFQNIKDIFK